MRDIKIRIDSHITDKDALALVSEVIDEGRVSTCRFGAQFCWATTMTRSDGSKFVVYSHRTKTMDVFGVYTVSEP